MPMAEILNEKKLEGTAFQKEHYPEYLKKAIHTLTRADCVLLGTGEELSVSGGLNLRGARFRNYFQQFFGQYEFDDVDSVINYSYKSEEEKWGILSKLMYECCIAPKAGKLYKKLFELLKDKEYFVVTTGTDRQFQKAGFAEKRLLALNGDLGSLQCQNGCHSETYDGISLATYFEHVRRNSKIPSYLLPKCPVCSGPMTINVRNNHLYIESDEYREAQFRLEQFIHSIRNKKIAIVTIDIDPYTAYFLHRFFENAGSRDEDVTYIRIGNKPTPVNYSMLHPSIHLKQDCRQVISDIYKAKKINKIELL